MESLKYLPMYSYVHVRGEGCPSGTVQQEHSFPNLYYCNGCDSDYFWLNDLLGDNTVMVRFLRHKRLQSIQLMTELDGFDYFGNFTCDKRNFNLRVNKKKGEHCYVGDYVVSLLQDKLNFSKHPLNHLNIHLPNVRHGVISNFFYDDFNPGKTPWNFLLIETEMTVLYCHFNPPQTSKMSFRAWWAQVCLDYPSLWHIISFVPKVDSL
jgi:hypothetical protein